MVIVIISDWYEKPASRTWSREFKLDVYSVRQERRAKGMEGTDVDKRAQVYTED